MKVENIETYAAQQEKKKYKDKDQKVDISGHSSSTNKMKNSDYPINTFLSTQATISHTTQKMSSKNVPAYTSLVKPNKLVSKKVQSSKNVVVSLNTLPGV